MAENQPQPSAGSQTPRNAPPMGPGNDAAQQARERQNQDRGGMPDQARDWPDAASTSPDDRDRDDLQKNAGDVTRPAGGESVTDDTPTTGSSMTQAEGGDWSDDRSEKWQKGKPGDADGPAETMPEN